MLYGSFFLKATNLSLQGFDLFLRLLLSITPLLHTSLVQKLFTTHLTAVSKDCAHADMQTMKLSPKYWIALGWVLQ